MNSKKYLILFLLISPFFLMANIIDKKTITDWSNVGNHFVIPTNAKKISITKFGGKADNLTDNSIALQNAIKSFNGEFGIILFPDGNFMFKKTISIPSNILIKGNGSNKTIFKNWWHIIM